MTDRDGGIPQAEVPESEIELFRRHVLSKTEYDDPNRIMETYRSLRLPVLPGRSNVQVVTRIIAAIREQKPLSVIRIGDGEGTVVAFRAYPGTPNLDRHTLESTVGIMKDSFRLSALWMTILRDLLLLAIRQADIIGVVGIGADHRPGMIPRKKRILHRLSHDIRGAVGSWRSIDLLIRFAQEGLLSGKTISHANLYFSVLENLDELLSNAPRVICINDNVEVSRAMKKKYPDSEFMHIATGKFGNASRTEELVAPEFLHDVERQLPGDLQGCLCLVGAGVWAEIYCTWIRARGGVGVDIGSGFDLLAGKVTRPIHRGVLGEIGNPFSLVKQDHD